MIRARLNDLVLGACAGVLWASCFMPTPHALADVTSRLEHAAGRIAAALEEANRIAKARK